MMKKILVIEDESSIADTIVYALKSEGFEPYWCATGMDGLTRCNEGDIDLIILDIGLPDASGFEILKKIRATSSLPVIFLTSRSSELDRVVGLEIGADDYVAKPFSPRELAARVKAVLRRSAQVNHVSNSEPGKPSDTIVGTEGTAAPFRIDTESMKITYFDQIVELTKCEFRLLAALIAHPGRIYTRDALKELAWDEPEFSLDRTVDTHIKTIRTKLRAVRSDIDPIETRRGFGYALKTSW
ncbi:MAG: two-component system response regulator CreB [Chitinispirillaceae bacterium]|nr:two-component system response regulator CreB [Chitinispirillaceae bacterium]